MQAARKVLFTLSEAGDGMEPDSFGRLARRTAQPTLEADETSTGLAAPPRCANLCRVLAGGG